MRRCAATRERLPKEALVRLAVAPDGTLVPDIEERLPGRGLWIAARRDIVERAVTKRLLARAAGAGVSAPRIMRGIMLSIWWWSRLNCQSQAVMPRRWARETKSSDHLESSRLAKNGGFGCQSPLGFGE